MTPKDILHQKIKGMGRKPPNTRAIRAGWCGFCQQSTPLKLTKGIGYLCPRCGGRLKGDHPGITRRIFKG